MGGIGDSYFLWESSSPLVSYRSHHTVDWQKWPELTHSLYPKESLKPLKALMTTDSILMDGYVVLVYMLLLVVANPSILYHSHQLLLLDYAL